MPEYVLIIRRSEDFEGTPLVASSDPKVVAAALRAIVEQVAGPERPRLLTRVLELERGDGGEPK